MPGIMKLAEHYTRPDWVRRLNRMGESVGGPEHLVPLDADALVRTAAVQVLENSGAPIESTRGHGPRRSAA